MYYAIQKLWWAVALRGLLLLGFGIIAVSFPSLSAEALVSYLGVLFLLFGVVMAGMLLQWGQEFSFRWLHIVFSVVDCVLGASILLYRSIAVDYFTTILALWALIMGLIMFVLASSTGPVRIFLVINGMLSVCFALLIYVNPITIGNSLNFLVGFYTILLGLFLMYVGFKMRQLSSKAKTPEEAVQHLHRKK